MFQKFFAYSKNYKFLVENEIVYGNKIDYQDERSRKPAIVQLLSHIEDPLHNGSFLFGTFEIFSKVSDMVD